MTQTLRIAIADDEPEMRDYLQETLSLLGHEIVAAEETGEKLVEACRSLRPDLVITDIKMPDMDGLEASLTIAASNPIPVILVSAFHDSELIERALDDHVLAYLIKPIKQADLETAIALAMRRFREFQALHAEADNLRQALADRKVIERAKGIMMKRTGLDEQEAFRRLQKLASEKNLKLLKLAEMIVTAEEALQ